MWVKTDLITTIDHHTSTSIAVVSNSNVKSLPQKPYWPRKNKPNRSYRNNNVFFHCSKRHNNYKVVVYLKKIKNKNANSINELK